MTNLTTQRHLDTETRLWQAIRTLRGGAALATRLALELEALTGRINALGRRAKQLAEAARSADRRQAIAAARRLVRAFEGEIAAFTRAIAAARGDYSDWLLSAERALQALPTPAAAPAARAELHELGHQVAALGRSAAGLTQALAACYGRLHTAMAATAGLDELQLALARCIEELYGLTPLVGRQDRLLQRIDVVTSFLLFAGHR